MRRACSSGVWSSDPGCGIDGYSLDWTTEALSNPDGIVETAGTTATSPALADGSSWYTHVRTVDVVGNAAVNATHMGSFWIDATPPTVSLTTPNRGETLVAGGTLEILFSVADPTSGISNVRVEYSADGGSTRPQIIFDGADPGGQVTWTIPTVDVSTARIRVTADQGSNENGDTSDSDFQISTSTTDVPEDPGALAFSLAPSFPNPTSSGSRIGFSLPEERNVRLEVFTISGRQAGTLLNRVVPSGKHQVYWDANDASGRPLPSGTYFYRLVAGGDVAGGRIVILR